MPTKKIADINQEKGAAGWGYTEQRCLHQEHNPPSMMAFSPGVWQHTCPGCGRSVVFTVHPSHMSTKDDLVVQSRVRPIDCTVHRSAEKDDGINPMHAFGYGRGD